METEHEPTEDEAALFQPPCLECGNLTTRYVQSTYNSRMFDRPELHQKTCSYYRPALRWQAQAYSWLTPALKAKLEASMGSAEALLRADEYIPSVDRELTNSYMPRAHAAEREVRVLARANADLYMRHETTSSTTVSFVTIVTCVSVWAFILGTVRDGDPWWLIILAMLGVGSSGWVAIAHIQNLLHKILEARRLRREDQDSE